MSGKNMVSENDLLAYVDDALDADRRAAVEAHLATHPVDAETVAQWRRQNEALASLYPDLAEEPVPGRLDVYRIAATHGRGAIRWPRMAAAAMLMLALGGVGGWFGHGMLTPAATGTGTNSLVTEALAAHSLYVGEVVHPVEVKATQQHHLSTWLSKRLDRPLDIPDLRSAGFTLVGGRLLPAGDKPAAQFMYENDSGRRVTLYVVPARIARERSFQYTSSNRLEAFYWQEHTISCALVGDLPRAQLRKLAIAAYQQLG